MLLQRFYCWLLLLLLLPLQHFHAWRMKSTAQHLCASCILVLVWYHMLMHMKLMNKAVCRQVRFTDYSRSSSVEQYMRLRVIFTYYEFSVYFFIVMTFYEYWSWRWCFLRAHTSQRRESRQKNYSIYNAISLPVHASTAALTHCVRTAVAVGVSQFRIEHHSRSTYQ